MDKAIAEVTASLKTIQATLTTLGDNWTGGKGAKGEVNTVVTGLCTQVKNMGEQFEKLVKSMKNAQGLNCEIGEDAKSYGRRNMDHIDDLDQ